ncbi:MAG: hypothetical protein K2H13_05855 [Eubacterium sp.]|nr:hypothetical protein [Eubacterium sp.]MDE6156028.1 hypothetical protein [Eubacterium sp.]MDE6768039.1 hypothetical protein [Eubacterium sp.]
MKESKLPDLLKNILYVILLFGLSAILLLTKIYCDEILQPFAYFVIGGAIAIINSFAFIALKKENSFYAIANLVCTALWIYPLYTKIQEALSDVGIWVYILVYILFLPAVAGCITEIISCCIKQEQAKKAAAAKKTLSIITIIITAAAIVLAVLSAVKLNTQIPKEIENKKEAYSNAVALANNIANDYKNSDLIIEEVLDKYQLTYDNSEQNYYIIEESNNIHITVDSSTEEGKNMITVSSDAISWGIPKLFEANLYESQTEQIPLK